jgi:hypothetical protein
MEFSPLLIAALVLALWVIPSEVTSALQGVSRAFTESLPRSPGT